jgi:hypothetical protein
MFSNFSWPVQLLLNYNIYEGWYWGEITKKLGNDSKGRKVYRIDFHDGDECDQTADNMHSLDEAMRMVDLGELVDPPEAALELKVMFSSRKELEGFLNVNSKVYAGYPGEKDGEMLYGWGFIKSLESKRGGRMHYKVSFVNKKEVVVKTRVVSVDFIKDMDEMLEFQADYKITDDSVPKQWLYQYEVARRYFETVKRKESYFKVGTRVYAAFTNNRKFDHLFFILNAGGGIGISWFNTN